MLLARVPLHLPLTSSDHFKIYGPMLIGVLFNTILYGVLIVQAFIYHQTYRNFKLVSQLVSTFYLSNRTHREPSWTRYFNPECYLDATSQILYLVILETLNTGFDIGLIYEPLIIKYGAALERIPIMLSADSIITVVIATPVQLFFARRIWILSNKPKLIVGVVVFLSISAFFGGSSVTICSALRPQFSQFFTYQGAVVTWLASSAAADIIIAASLVVSLRGKKTGIKSTDDTLRRIIRLTVQTGMVTAIFATLDVILYLAVQGAAFNFIWDFPLSKLYTNSLLSTLNARAGWKDGFGSDQDDMIFVEDSNQQPVRRVIPAHSSDSDVQKAPGDEYELGSYKGVRITPSDNKSDV
ncbi:hypothetical protein ONZ45_g13395 [Pleurotus djamor]|nr:hypothetical protein ONZ45_g13395 [Pleurotus djamor]